MHQDVMQKLFLEGFFVIGTNYNNDKQLKYPKEIWLKTLCYYTGMVLTINNNCVGIYQHDILSERRNFQKTAFIVTVCQDRLTIITGSPQKI